MTEKFGISIPDELDRSIKERLEYGDDRSEWIREAIELRIALEEMGWRLDEMG